MSTRFRSRRAPAARLAALPVALATVAITAPSALADQPVFEIGAQFSLTSQGGTTVVPDSGPGPAAVRSSSNAGVTAGHWGQLAYCNPYGPGTSLVGYLVLLGRWHAAIDDKVVLLHNTDHGTRFTTPDRDLPHRTATGAGAWNGAAPAMTPTQCVGVQVVARNTTGGGLVYTVDLERVAVQDSIGPWVASPAVEAGWVTGDHVPVSWDQGDNLLARGTTSAEVVGGGRVDLGDPGDGRVGTLVPLGSLGDGTHVVRVHRTGNGWTPRSAEVTVNVDRSDPAIPELAVERETWTNATSVAVTAAAGADSGSGWARNEHQVNGGAWRDLGTRWTVTTPGVHVIRARAVDHAGRVSTPSAEKVVRIDRSAPTFRTFEVDGSAPSGARLRVSAADTGGAGLGECPAEVTLIRPDGVRATVLDAPGRALSGVAEIDVPMRSLPSGEYALAVRVCDIAGNTTSRTARFTWSVATPATAPSGATTAPAPTAAPTPVAPPAGIATVTPSAGPATAGRTRLELAGAVQVTARRGGTAVLRGRLLRGGHPVQAGIRVALVDPRGRRVTVVRAGRDGRIVVRFAPRRPGRWTLRLVDAPRGGVVVVTVRLVPVKGGAR